MASTPAHSWQIPVIFSVSTPSHLWWLIECCLILLIFLLIRFKWHILWSNTFSWRQNEAKWLRTKRENYEVDIFWCDTENLNIFRCDKDQMNIIWRYKDNCRISCGASPLQSIRWFFATLYFATECLFSTAYIHDIDINAGCGHDFDVFSWELQWLSFAICSKRASNFDQQYPAKTTLTKTFPCAICGKSDSA